MKARRLQSVRLGLFILLGFCAIALSVGKAQAAPYAALVMDARTGDVLHSRNADTKLHPASLTKMMTLYIVFDAVERGEISLDTKIKISKHAASEPPSKLGLRAGQRIKLRYLIRAAAVKSANDASTALGEAISGSEAAFAKRMNQTAKGLGMTRTTFKNAHGLTQKGHMSTARDMTILGRHLLYDFPDYYHLFSRQSIDAGVRAVPNTNRRLLSNYKGADGIKTGYTRAAGFNLVASAERGNQRIIATVFGGTSSAARNARVAKLLDMGFKRAPSSAPLRRPQRPIFAGNSGSGGKVVRVSGLVKTSHRPPVRFAQQRQVASISSSDIDAAVAVAQATSTRGAEGARLQSQGASAVTLAGLAPRRPGPEIVTRLSTSGGRHWGVNVGSYESRYKAEKCCCGPH